MPCDAGPAYGHDETYERLNAATRAACEMAAVLGWHGVQKLSAETQKWVSDHEEMDRQRIAKERAAEDREKTKRLALNKLTVAERKALGVY